MRNSLILRRGGGGRKGWRKWMVETEKRRRWGEVQRKRKRKSKSNNNNKIKTPTILILILPCLVGRCCSPILVMILWRCGSKIHDILHILHLSTKDIDDSRFFSIPEAFISSPLSVLFAVPSTACTVLVLWYKDIEGHGKIYKTPHKCKGNRGNGRIGKRKE